jgi:hypothetical protein
VKGGKVPLITFNAQGSSVTDLRKTENILIKGNIVEGKIFVPKAHLYFEDVSGDVVISQGVLEGRNLEAQLENAHGREGTLRLGLKGKDAPLHLETMMEVHLSQVPPLLRRYMKLRAKLWEGWSLGKAQNRSKRGLIFRNLTCSPITNEFDIFWRFIADRFPMTMTGTKSV